MKTGLITSDTYQNHNTGDGHPEKIDRVTAVIDNFKKLDNRNLIWKKPNKFEKSFLIKTHTSNYIDQVNKSFPKKCCTIISILTNRPKAPKIKKRSLNLIALFKAKNLIVKYNLSYSAVSSMICETINFFFLFNYNPNTAC